MTGPWGHDGDLLLRDGEAIAHCGGGYAVALVERLVEGDQAIARAEALAAELATLRDRPR